jgi:tRNA nucleotidyltransferase (CCA-adding enzyme)
MRTDHPSRAFSLLDETRLLRFMPELDALRGVPQDPEWHPEGDVWVHTLMALDQAALLRGSTAQEESHDDDADDLALMLGTLCHDLGKPLTTETTDGRVRSPNHCRAGLAPTESLLTRWRAPHRLVERVLALVDHHLAPAHFIAQRSGPRGYRRLSRNLERAGVSLELLTRVARADHLGRTTEEALRGEFPAGDRFLERAAELAVERRGPVDVVQGRHLIARGLVPGPEFGSILARCRDIQDEAGETDPASILDRVLGRG